MAEWWEAAPLAEAPRQSGGGQFAEAIGGIESRGSGGYQAIGPETGRGRALGKYQIMTGNIGPWSKEVLGREVSPNEFMADPKIQDAIFEGKFGQYVQKYGPEGASRAWFAGEGGMNDRGRKDVLGTSVDDYSRKFTGALGFAPESGGRDIRVRPVGSAPSQSSSDSWWKDAPLAQSASAQETAPQPPAATPDAPADKGALNAGIRGAMQGFAFNLGDEIDALGDAGGFGKKQQSMFGGEYEDRSIVPLVRGFYNYMRGDPETVKAYDEAVKRIRDEDRAAQEQHPVASTVGNVAGAVAVPLGGVLNAATLPARIGRGVVVGAGTGALYGAGEGEGAMDRASRATGGALLGGAIGGAAPAAIEGVIRAGRAIAQPVATAIRGIRNPDDEAARRVATAIQQDIRIDPQAASRLTPQEFAASHQSGGPATLMDVGGETTRALARSAANTSPEGRAVLGRTINDRFEGQGDRVTGWLRNTFHFPNADAQRQALEQTARNVNRPNYARAMQDGAHGVWSPELQRLAGAPAIRQASQGAVPSLANRGISEGFRAPRGNPLVWGPQGRATLRQTSSGNQVVPDLRFWDQVKRSLDSQIGKAQRAGDRPRVAELTELNRTLVAELDNLVPSYQAARAGAAHFFGAQDALEAGRNFVTNNMNSGEARRALAQMSTQERQLFQDGFVSDFVARINQIGDRRSVLNSIANSPAAREKLHIALGPQRAQELEAGLRVEGIMDLARNAVQGNSTTARQLAELGLAGGTYTIGTGGNILNPDPTALMSAALVYGAARGRNRINENLSRRVAEMLTSNDPAILLRGIRTVTRNQQMFNSLRSVDQSLARVGGNQSSGVPALQAAGIGRAEDQPDVPRPER